MTGLKASEIRDKADPSTITRWTGPDLLAQPFDPIRWAVRGLFPEGAGLVTAAPKVGKSLLLTDVVLAVGSGQPLWDTYPVTQGPVLWLALEDGARRIKQRMLARPKAAKALTNDFAIRTVSKTLNDGGRDEIEAWIDAKPGAVLVVIDVLARVRDREDKRSASVYADDYAALEPLQKLAAERHICLPVVHHNRKLAGVDDDPFERISGTQGLLGSVDWAMVLMRRRGDTVAELHTTGRDLADQRLALDFRNGLWSPSAMPVEIVGKREPVRNLWLAMRDQQLTTEAAAKVYGQSENATVHMLNRLFKEGLVDQVVPPGNGRKAEWKAVTADRLPSS